MSEAYAELCGLLREAARLSSAVNLMNWDQETMMPPRAAPLRAEALASVGRLAHERFTDPRIGELIERCLDAGTFGEDSDEAANLREMRRDFDRATRLPADLVGEMGETSSRALEAWKQARADNDFGAFLPWLTRQIELNRRKAACYGTPQGGEPYDALVEDYEPGMSGAALERIFAPLRQKLVPLIREIDEAGPLQATAPPTRIPVPLQLELNRRVLEQIGFDDDAGRLDVSVHPFSSGIAPGDTRITTRYRESDWTDGLSSTLHEAGHALYEQGLPKTERWGQPLAEPLGLGIHESQSRMWENHVGRSRAFWGWLVPLAREIFDGRLDGTTADNAYRTVNVVQPHLIRIESDEATYNLHIMLRFDLERALLRGDLAPADLPGAWNERILNDLGLRVPDDAHGCLQDIHWSMGSIGYFPTYTLGNLYAAQLWEAILREVPSLDQRIAEGDFSPLLDWLRERIHAVGRRVSTDDLCRTLTGEPLDHRALMRHLGTKFGEVYGIV